MPKSKQKSSASSRPEIASPKQRRRLHRLRDDSSSEDDSPDFSDTEQAIIEQLPATPERAPSGGGGKGSAGKAKAAHRHRVRRQRGDSSDEEDERMLLDALSGDLSPSPGGRVEKAGAPVAAGSAAGGKGKPPASSPASTTKKKRVRRARDANSSDEEGGGPRAAASKRKDDSGDEREEEEEWEGEEAGGLSSQATVKGEGWKEEVDGGLRGSQATTRGSPASEEKGGKRRKRLRRAEEREEEARRARQELSEVFGGGGRRREVAGPPAAPKVEREIMNEVKQWARGARAGVARARGKQQGEEGGQEEDEEEEDEDGLGDFIVEDEDEDGDGDFYVRCVCGATSPGEDQDERLWVECSNPECGVWVHGDCFGLATEKDVPRKFKCHVCDPKGTSRLMQAEAMAAKTERLVSKYPVLQLYSLLEKGGGQQGFRDAMQRLGGGKKALRLTGPYKKSGVTLLMKAAELGRVEEVRVLLEAGAAPLSQDHKGRRSAAMYALAGNQADDDACIQVLKQLVDAEAAVLSELDGHRRNLLHYAGCRPSGSVLAWLLARLGEAQARRMAGQRDEEGKTPLLAACDEGSEEAVLQLLSLGADAACAVSDRGVNGLMLCISRGMTKAAVAMAGQGSDELLLQRDDQEGASCLHYAAGQGDAASAEAILERVGAELVDTGDDNQVSALHLAAANGYTEVVTALLRHGARPDVRDEQGWTPLLYADFKAQEDTILSLLAVDPHSQLVVLGELLRSKRGTDERVARVLKGLTVVPSYLRFINDLVARDPQLLDTSLDFLLDQPDLLDLRNKTMYLERQLEDLRESSPAWDPYGLGISLYLKRHGTWPDLCRKLLRKEPSAQMVGTPEATLRGRVMFQLAGDPGIGPGVEREVLDLLSRGLVEEGGEAAAFQQAADLSSYVPLDVASSSSKTPDHDVRRTLYAVGLLLGHVLLWRKVLSVNLNACFLKLVLRRPITLDDMADLDGAVHRSLKYILEHEGVEEMELSFTWSAGLGGEDVPLCKDGAKKRVTDHNKAEYVQLVVKHLTHGRMGEQAACLRDGIGAVLHDPRGRLLGLYTAQEFGVLVSGVGVIDAARWEQHSTYCGYRSTSPQIEWFWRFVRSLSATERALLLKFCTGQSRLPVGGFESLSPRFQVVWLPFERNQPMPQAATCFHQLKLPCYPSYEELERWVLLAIRFGSDGFAFT